MRYDGRAIKPNTTNARLVRIEGLSQELGPPVRLLRTLMAQRKIPYVKIGHRTVLFEVDKVREALAKFEVKAVGQ